MINTVKDYKKLSEQYNKMVAERNSLIDDLSWYKAKVNRLQDEKDDMLLEREYYKNGYKDMTRICKEMEREIEDREKSHIELYCDKKALHDENKKLTNRVRKLNLNGQMQHDDLMMCDAESQSYKSLLSEISQHIGNKPSSSTYKYFRAKLDGIGIKEGE